MGTATTRGENAEKRGELAIWGTRAGRAWQAQRLKVTTTRTDLDGGSVDTSIPFQCPVGVAGNTQTSVRPLV